MQPRKNTWPLPLRADRGEVGHRLGLQRVRRRGGPQALSCGRGAQALASLTECPCVCGDRVGTWVGHEWVWAWWFEAGLCIHLGIRVYSRVFNLRAGKVQNTRIHLAILVYSACRGFYLLKRREAPLARPRTQPPRRGPTHAAVENSVSRCV